MVIGGVAQHLVSRPAKRELWANVKSPFSSAARAIRSSTRVTAEVDRRLGWRRSAYSSRRTLPADNQRSRSPTACRRIAAGLVPAAGSRVSSPKSGRRLGGSGADQGAVPVGRGGGGRHRSAWTTGARMGSSGRCCRPGTVQGRRAGTRRTPLRRPPSHRRLPGQRPRQDPAVLTTGDRLTTSCGASNPSPTLPRSGPRGVGPDTVAPTRRSAKAGAIRSRVRPVVRTRAALNVVMRRPARW